MVGGVLVCRVSVGVQLHYSLVSLTLDASRFTEETTQ